MQAAVLCLQRWRYRIRQQPARRLRMFLVSMLLAYILYQSARYSTQEDSNTDVPDIAESSPHPHRLRLRIRSRPSAEGRRMLPLSKWRNQSTDLSKQQPSKVTEEQARSISMPLRVAIMTVHYFGDEYARTVSNCTLEGIPLQCSYFQPNDKPDFGEQDAEVIAADAVWWHAPNTCLQAGGPWQRSENDSFSFFKARAEQWSVLASMESSAYYKCLEDAAFMENFDIRMTYHRTAEVPLLYWNARYKDAWERQARLPITERKNAVAFVNSNCETPSGRNQIVTALSEQTGITVDALGRCLSDGASILSGADAKQEAFQRYKYCIAIENSIAKDYVTEKVYDALAAGCLPIYYGAPNIKEFIPSMDAIIDYRAFGSPAALAQELRRLSANHSAYIEKFKWRERPETWTEEFRSIQQHARKDVHTQCQLCQVIAKDRAGIIDPARGKLLRRLALSPGANQSWIIASKLHVKNLKIQYKMVGS